MKAFEITTLSIAGVAGVIVIVQTIRAAMAARKAGAGS